MTPSRLQAAARILFWATLAAIAVVTLGPIAVRPTTGLPVWMERFGAFALVSGLAILAYPQRRLILLAALVLVAALLELGQTLSPGRHGRLLDFDEKAAGVLTGYGAAVFASLLRRATSRGRVPAA